MPAVLLASLPVAPTQVPRDSATHSVILVPLTGSPAPLRLTSTADGVLFDLRDDGIPRKISWTAPGSDVAFLARDIDGDGRITSGKELFGNFTVPGVTNGFQALSELQFQESTIRRGDISEEDPLFTTVLLWTDRNHNGMSEPDELRPFGEEFSAILLGWRHHHRRDGFGNRFAYEGWVMKRTKPGRNRTESGADAAARRRTIYEVFFTIR